MNRPASILTFVQARASSSRLPGKVLLPLLGKPMLYRQLERVRRAQRIGRLVVATSTHASDDAVQALCDADGFECFRGNLDDVLDRFYQAAVRRRPDVVVRLTGDCPLIDPQVIDSVIDFLCTGDFDYASNALEPTFPDGLDVEAFRFDCLETAWREARLPSQREHVTLFVHRQPERFKLGSFRQEKSLSHLRWTVDEPADFELVKQVYEALYPVKADFSTADVLDLLASQPALRSVNPHIPRNEGLRRSLQRDPKAS